MGSTIRKDVHALDPEAAATLGRVFKDAWQSLERAGSPFAQPARAEEARETLALRIIDCAQRGERDPRRLREDALSFLQASAADLPPR
ncbi:MAG: hypothetical protein IRZ09_12685 [Variibacter sp.]|nr:hypothetical protein [Variibacter sp.]